MQLVTIEKRLICPVAFCAVVNTLPKAVIILVSRAKRTKGTEYSGTCFSHNVSIISVSKHIGIAKNSIKK